MGNILHANAKTTPRIRKEIQESTESFVKIAKKYNINPKTAEKWKKADIATTSNFAPIAFHKKTDYTLIYKGI